MSVNSSLVSIDDNTIEFDDNVKIGEVLDGQHRLLGLLYSIFPNRDKDKLYNGVR